jgi:phosphopantetheinyl transferase
MNQVILAYSQLRGALPAAQRQQLRAQLPYARRLRLSLDAGRQSQTYLGLALACRLLGAATGRQVEPSQLRFTRAGKPCMIGGPEFSIAHAGDWVLCALAADGTVGIDVEVRDSARFSRAALALWTAREATVKAAGATFAELPQVQVRGRRIGFLGRRWYCRTPRLAPRLVVRLVTERPVTRLLVRVVSVEAALAA